MTQQKIPGANFKLRPALQQYAWGRAAVDSIIPSLFPQARHSAAPLAELWWGTHPSAPAVVEEGDQRLDVLCRDRPELLGATMYQRYQGSLPFLLKVLSIARPLSIQLHPDAQTAVQLHNEDPAHYPDTNPKPEIGVALSDTELLYGFRPTEEIAVLLQSIPELAGRIELAEGGLERAFAQVYALTTEECTLFCQQIYHQAAQGTYPPPLAHWISKSSDLYPEGDVGVLVMLFLNLMQLVPGEAVFIAANIPHAYLSGEVLECMACSDNVVRAGFTAKFCDVPRLLALADYSAASTEKIQAVPCKGAASPWRQYPCPAEQFSLFRYQGTATLPCAMSESAELVLCLAGEARLETGTGLVSLQAGDVQFLSAAMNSAQLVCDNADVVRIAYS